MADPGAAAVPAQDAPDFASTAQDAAGMERRAGVDAAHPFGRLGHALASHSPLRSAFLGGIGLLAAYTLFRGVELARGVLTLVVLAGFLAVGLNPFVEWLCRHRLRRGLAVTAVLLAVVGGLAGFAAAVVPRLAHQMSGLTHSFPGYLARLRGHSHLFASLDRRYHLVARATTFVHTHHSSLVHGLLGAAHTLATMLVSTVTVVVLTVYLLSDYHRVKHAVYRMVPHHRRARVALLTDAILARVGAYVVADLFTSLIAVVTSYLMLRILGVPYAGALAVFVGIADLIPLVGHLIAGAATVTTAFFHSPIAGVGMICFHLVYQQVENYLLNPRVMQRAVHVSPLVIILVALVGATLFGMLGALLAVPVAATLQLLAAEVVWPRQESV